MLPSNLTSRVLLAIVKTVPDVIPLLSDETKAAIKATGYDGIRTVMRGAIFGAVYGYLSGTGYVTNPRLAMATAISQAYIETADVAYVEGGGELPIDEETATWARGELDAQLSFVDQLFETLRDLRKEGVDAGEEANSRADGYCNSLDGFHNEMVLRGAGNKMLTFVQLRDTKESCDDCVRLRGQRHRASWWIEHDLVPPKGGGLACSPGGECGDGLVDDDGNEITL
jgi:hypothetical protein